MKESSNIGLLVVDFKTEHDTYYTKQSLLAYVCDRLDQDYEVYHESNNASIYAHLKNTSKEGVYVSLRISDHDVVSRGFIAATGGADEEIVFRDDHDLDDLDEMIEDVSFCIENYIV